MTARRATSPLRSIPRSTEQQLERDPSFPEALRQTEEDLLRRRAGHRLPTHVVGFGLSGGGIRSATFCLGVFQGLARLKLLSTIDYLSTVSGGGYFGAFYGRLFSRSLVSGIRDVEEILTTHAVTAEQRGVADGDTPLRARIFRWLRDNGRYLAPNGSGDLLVAGAALLRNFVAIHVVVATFILMIFLAAQLLRGVIEVKCRVGELGQCWWWTSLQDDLSTLLGGQAAIWWSPYAVLVPVLFCFLAIPPGWGYWLVEKPNRDTAGRWIPPFYGWLAVVLLSLPGSILGICNHIELPGGACRLGRIAGASDLLPLGLSSHSLVVLSVVVLFIALETFIWGLINGYRPRFTLGRSAPAETVLFNDERVRLRLSVQLKTMLVLTGGALAFVLVDSLAQTFYGATLVDEFRPRIWLTAILAPLVGLAGFGRTLVSWLGGGTPGKRFRLSWNLVAGAIAVLLAAIVLVAVDAGAYLIAWNSRMPPGPRPNWTTTQRVNDARQVEVTRLRTDPVNTPRCADEALGMVVRIDGKTLTLNSTEGEITLALAHALEDIRAGDTVRALYRKSNGRLNARFISRVTPEPTPASSEGWRIAAGTPTPKLPECGSRESFAALIPAVGAFVITFVFSFLFGWSWPFLNRSTHQPLYTSRLVRAYLGASNPRRLGATGKSVTQPIRGDDVNQEDYWPRYAWLRPGSEPAADGRVEDGQLLAKIHDDEERLLAKGMPLHLINVTINETLDAQTQVEQRDRKGIGMAVGPAAISVGVFHHLVVANARQETARPSGEARALEAEVYPGEGAYRIFRYDPSPLPGRLNYTGEFLTLGGWTGISGAAFSTSLGWRSSLAFSLLAGLGNVRLTYWWNSGVKPLDRFSRRAAMTRRRMRHRIMRLFHHASSAPAVDQDAFPESRTSWALRWLSGALRGLFSVQTFLFDEFLARFHGTAPQWWPLSDGGHFENLGGYELIRRRLPVIVIIDAEADPDYTFEGLSNLVRKARLDFGAEITFLTEEELNERLHPAVRRHFGTIEQLRRGVWVEEPIGDPNDPKAGEPPDTGTGERKLRRRRTINPVTDEALSLAHAALAEVKYDGDAGRPSTLLYIKPTLIGDEPTDVRRYHTDHPSFPHETTLQQFFAEAQWESYRKLGEQIALKVFQEPPADLQGGGGSLFPHRLLSSPPA